MKFQNHIGLDIGGSTIKLVQLAASGDKFNLSSIAIAEASKVEKISDKDIADSEIVKKMVHDSGAVGKMCVVSLPESQVYTRVVEMPFMEEPDLSTTIKWQAEQYIPVALENVVLKHQIISLPENGVPGAKMTVLLVAAPNELVNRYLEILVRAKLEAAAVETEIFAVARAIVAGDSVFPVTLLVNMGSDITTLAVLKKGDLSLTQTVGLGGRAMNRSLTSGLGLEDSQAEEYKKSYGLDLTKLEGKVFKVIAPVVDQVLTEVKKVIAFYETRPDASAVKRVVLAGGTALMPGLLGYFSQNLGLEVQLGNPFSTIVLNDKQKQAVYDAGPLFAASVGLAMKLT